MGSCHGACKQEFSRRRRLLHVAIDRLQPYLTQTILSFQFLNSLYLIRHNYNLQP